MSLDKHLLIHIENALSISIISQKSVSGGSINEAYLLQTTAGSYFIKVNNKNSYPAMFKAEAKGLQLIRKSNTIAVPEVILEGDLDDQSFLALEWLSSVTPSPDSSVLLGRQLAGMHKCTADYFGLDHDNYMGSLPQSNTRHKLWSPFFVENRLMPMVKIARDKAFLSERDSKNFENLYQELPDLFDEEPPSLLHGDLWSGNYLIAFTGTPYLVDPAVSYGLREFDVAMTTLFGGFSNDFYQAYHEEFPLSKGWEQRLDLWNLYPLLLHLNLFGSGYLGRVRSGLAKYI